MKTPRKAPPLPTKEDMAYAAASKEMAAIGMVDLWDECHQALKGRFTPEMIFGNLLDKLYQVALINGTDPKHMVQELKGAIYSAAKVEK